MGKQDHPGGPVVKNPPASAGDMRSIPGPGRPHMPRGNQALVLDSLCFSAGEATQWEARTLTPEQPRSRQLEKARSNEDPVLPWTTNKYN